MKMKKEIVDPIIYLSVSLFSLVMVMILGIFERFTTLNGEHVTSILDIWGLSMIVIGILLLAKHLIKKYPYKWLIVVGLIINLVFFSSIVALA